MNIYMPTSTTGRHNRMTGTLFSAIIELLKTKEVYALHEEGALVHWGHKGRNDLKSLVDLNDIDNIDDFLKITINELDYVQPDFFLFKNNKYIHNERETKVAGYPDLIIEVWSKDNSKAERDFKLALYSSSQITEHWYIEQDSNTIICYLGCSRIENQSLTDILVSRGGLKFDLRYLAI